MVEIAAETERLLLREWTAPDETAFYEVMNTPAVMRHLGGLQTPAQNRLSQTAPPVTRDLFGIGRHFLQEPGRD